MMENWIVFAFVGGAMLALILVGRLLARLDVRELPNTHVDLDAFDSVEGLERVANRAVYEAHLVEFVKRVEPFEAQVELCDGRKENFTRVTIDFPLRLHMGIRLQVELSEGFANRLLQAREIEIGDDEFDSTFLIFAPDAERVSNAIEPALRQTLIELAEEAGDVRLSDETLLVVYPSLLDAEQVVDVLDKMLDVARRYTERGKEIYDQSREGDVGDTIRPGSGPLKAMGV